MGRGNFVWSDSVPMNTRLVWCRYSPIVRSAAPLLRPLLCISRHLINCKWCLLHDLHVQREFGRAFPNLTLEPGRNWGKKKLNKLIHRPIDRQSNIWYCIDNSVQLIMGVSIEIVRSNNTENTVEPRSNGPALNGIPPITDINFWSFQPVFFYFLYLL